MGDGVLRGMEEEGEHLEVARGGGTAGTDPRGSAVRQDRSRQMGRGTFFKKLLGEITLIFL